MDCAVFAFQVARQEGFALLTDILKDRAALEDLQRTLGIPVACGVVSAGRMMLDAVNEGTTLFAMDPTRRERITQDLAAIVELNRQFHGLFVTEARNPPFASSLTAVTHAAVVRQNFQHYSPGALARSLAHHTEMVEAARAREPEWAEAVMRSHLYNARATMLGDSAEVNP